MEETRVEGWMFIGLLVCWEVVAEVSGIRFQVSGFCFVVRERIRPFSTRPVSCRFFHKALASFLAMYVLFTASSRNVIVSAKEPRAINKCFKYMRFENCPSCPSAIFAATEAAARWI